jgi:hypothetical protein
VSRGELLAALRVNHTLSEFVRRAQAASGGTGTGLSVFESIEQDDNDSLSWDEFKSYFVSSGALDDDPGG